MTALNRTNNIVIDLFPQPPHSVGGARGKVMGVIEIERVYNLGFDVSCAQTNILS